MKASLFLGAALAAALLASPAFAHGSNRHHHNNGGVNSGSNSSSNSGAQAGAAAGASANSTYRDRLQAPGASAPDLATGNACEAMGSKSFGGSGPGFGLSFGFTTNDSDCLNGYKLRLMKEVGLGAYRRDYLLSKYPDIRAVVPQRGQARVARPSAANGGAPRACNKWVGDVVGGQCSY